MQLNSSVGLRDGLSKALLQLPAFAAGSSEGSGDRKRRSSGPFKTPGAASSSIKQILGVQQLQVRSHYDRRV